MTTRLSLLLLLWAVAEPALAQDTPRDLRDLVGARAGQAERELAQRGYRNVGSEAGDDRSYTNWWSADRRQCVTIATMNGRYDSIVSTLPADCRQSATVARGRSRDDRRGWRDDYSPEYGGPAGDRSRTCKSEASAAFDRRPSELTTNAPIEQRTGTIVQGWYDRDRGTRFFTCRFDADGRFLGVN